MSSFESGTPNVRDRALLPRVNVCAAIHGSPACRQRNCWPLMAGAPPGTVPADHVASTSSDRVDVAAGVGPLFGVSIVESVMSPALMVPVGLHAPVTVGVA